MSIEAMNQALDALVKSKKALEVLWVSHHANRTDYAIEDIESAIKALRTAIQQAEVQQPATGEPVANDEAPPDGMTWFYCSTPIKEASGWQYWRVAGRNLLHAKEQFDRGEGDIVEQEVEVTDLEPPEWVAIDAAMLAAKDSK